jgi:Excalibur calcium-binding domain
MHARGRLAATIGGMSALGLLSVGCQGSGPGRTVSGTLPATGASASSTGIPAGVPTSTDTSAPPAAVSTKVATGRPVGVVPRPNPSLTPGSVLTTDLSQICPRVNPAVEAARPDETVKDAVYAEYGVVSRVTGEYEIDHLIPLELGGANTIRNLWPELNDHPKPGVINSKDLLENKLHDLVCAGQLSMTAAEHAIATDWYAAYLRYVSPVPLTGPVIPAAATTAAPPSPTASAAGSAVYYRNCAAVRAAGKAPLYRGQPGYRSGLDADGNGVACQ